MALTVGGAVGRFFRLGNQSGPVPVSQTALSSLRVAQLEAPNTEILRAGRRFAGGHINGATFQAQQTAVPTTTAGFLLYNGESNANGKSYVVDFVGHYLAGGTAGTGESLWGGVLQAGAGLFTVPTTIAAGTGITSLSGSQIASKAKTALAAAVVQNSALWQWALLDVSSVAALMAGSRSVIGYGIALVPPGGALALTVVSAAGTTPTFGIAAHWAELELDIE